MNRFDTIIIGGGLAGLVCGIRLAKDGKRCLIFSSGQSAVHFSSGSFDLLNKLPDGTPVDKPLESVEKLARHEPRHPYVKLGPEKFGTLAREAKSFFDSIGLRTKGSEELNHYRVSPIGRLLPTWLTFADYAASESGTELPWKKAALFSIVGFLDFYPRYIMSEFAHMGTEVKLHHLNLPGVERLRRNPSELRSMNIAYTLENGEDRSKLIRAVKEGGYDADAVILPACMGLKDDSLLRELERHAGKPVYMIPTMPPSIAGIYTQQYLKSCFEKCGGIYMLGDIVLRGDVEDNRVKRVYTHNHGDIAFEADDFVLATGSYFSQGMVANRTEVIEPVFGLDVDFIGGRTEWYDKNVFGKQPYESFGVKTDGMFRAQRDGEALENLYVAGAVLEGFNGIKEGCGGGVSILSALDIAGRIGADG